MSRSFNVTLQPPVQSSLQGPSSAVYTSLTQFTVAAWVKLDQVPPMVVPSPLTPSGTIFNKSPLVNPSVILEVAGGGSNTIFVEVLSSLGHFAVSEVSGSFIPLSTWVHIALTFNYSTDRLVHIYINGVEPSYLAQITEINPGEVPPNDTGGYWVGSNPNAVNTTWPGEISEFAVWNQALGATQILQLAMSKSGVPATLSGGLVGYWHLCGLKVLGPEPDFSGNGNSLVVVNAAKFYDSPGFTCLVPGIPLQITQQPVNQNVSSGQTATFSVSAIGSGALSYQWATNNPRLIGPVFQQQPGTNGQSSGGAQGVYDLGVGSQYEALYPLPFFELQSGFAEPGGLIPGATASTYTTPVLQDSDNGTQLTCFIIQIVHTPQSVGNLNVDGKYGPVTNPLKSFSVIASQAAILQVH